MKFLFTSIVLAMLTQQVNGQSWVLNYSTPNATEQIVALSAPNDAVCWFVTNFDNLYKTANGGDTWVKIPPTATSFNPSGLYVVDETLAFKSSNQSLFRTTDGGLTWSAVFTGSSFSPPVVQMKDATIGVVTSGGVLYKTTTGGLSWSTANVTQPPLAIQNTSGKGSVFNLGDELWVTQQNGGIAYSPNFGATWTTPSNIGFTTTGVNTRISFANTNFGIATKGSVSPYVFVTTDGAATWTIADNSLGANEDVVADGTLLWYIPNPADHFYIKNSQDSGATWQIQLQLNGSEGFNVLEKSRTGHRLWAGTSKGKLYQYTPLLSLADFGNSTISMYPNPASGAIYFREPTINTIELYNTLGTKVAGKEIHTMQDSFLDIANLPNGVYIAKIKTIKKEYSLKLVVQN